MRIWLRLHLAATALLVCLALDLLAWPSVAHAQPAQVQAQKQLVEGDRAAQAGKWEEALAAYQKAHTTSPSAASATRTANALYKLGRVTAAADAYEALLTDFGKTLLGGDKKTANDRIAELSEKTGTLTIRVSEAGATVAIDGAAVGTSPLTKPVRVLTGPRAIRVSKDGFGQFDATVEVGPKTSQTVDVPLRERQKGGKVTVTVKGGEALEVLVDDAVVGPAPWEGVLPAGPHTIGGKSATRRAAAVTVEVKEGVDAAVELVPGAPRGTLEVRTEHPKAEIAVDGERVGAGTFQGQVDEGEHEIRVTLEGYETVVKKVTVPAGEVLVETVNLRKATAGAVAETIERPWTFDGLYGGFQFVGMFEPAGSGNTLDSGCEVLGATSCDGGLPMGGGLGGFLGYAFAPLGLELFLLGAGDVVEPKASFDGVTGSDVNPLVASPAREEEFIIARFGGGGAARLRVLFPVDRFRFTGALGAGLAYRHLLLGRDTVAANGAESSIGSEEGDGYLSGVLSLDLGAQVLLAGTASLTLGFSLWLEHAGDGVVEPSRSNVLLTKDGEVPAPQATPEYEMASGTQVFLGPYVGFFFGP